MATKREKKGDPRSAGTAKKNTAKKTKKTPANKTERQPVKKAKKVVRKTVGRTFFVDTHLGFGGTALWLDKLAGGDQEARQKRALEIKDGIIAICKEVGGKVVREDRDDFVESDGEDEFEGFDWCMVEVEFPSVDATQRAVENVRDSYDKYGVTIHNTNAHHMAQFLTLDMKDVGLQDSIREYILNVCTEHGGNRYDSFASSQWKGFFDDYEFETVDQIEAAFRAVRAKCSGDLVRFSRTPGITSCERRRPNHGDEER